MPDDPKANVRDMDARAYAAHKATLMADLLKLAPRYRSDLPVPGPTSADGKPVPVASLSGADYTSAKAGVKRGLSGFGGMRVSPGLDETPKAR